MAFGLHRNAGIGKVKREQMTEITERQSVNTDGFDYSRLDDGLAEELRSNAQRIKSELASQTQSIIDTGNMLIRAKSKLAHGLFSRWVESEIGVSVRTAENYIRVAKLAFECKS